MDISEAIERELTRRNLNPSQLARLLGVSKSRIHDWQNGTMPRQSRLRKIASALQTTVEDLVGFGKKRK